MSNKEFFVPIYLAFVLALVFSFSNFLDFKKQTGAIIGDLNGLDTIKDISDIKIDSTDILDNIRVDVDSDKTTDIINIMPSGKFIYPLYGAYLSDIRELKFQVENAKAVEFYIRRPESLTEIYLGSAVFSKDKNVWIYYLLTNSTPNADYFIYSKITNEYGKYNGSSVYITVKNDIDVEESVVQNLVDNIKIDEDNFEIEEQNLIDAEEQLKIDISTEIQELSEKADEILNGDNEDVKIQIYQQTQDLSQKAQGDINNILNTNQGQEQVKELINQDIERIINLIRDTSDSEEAEILELREEKQENIDKLIDKVQEILKKQEEVEIEKQELFVNDSDGDGISDKEEIRLKTNPLSVDSDQDGFLDGTEIALGYDPLNPSPADKIKYEDPKEKKIEVSEKYKVEKVELVSLEEKPEEKVLKIEGKAPPYSFVTIYIYSLPIVVVTKADANGNWQYILDKPLDDGQHQVYATVTNNVGEIDEKSESFDFAKTGEKVFRIFASQGEAQVASPVQEFKSSFIILIISTIIFVLGIAFISIGFFMRERT
ncbi:MAG: Ig-like domain-containing protein [Candidatus Nealsonbacteria bacterium]